jgi:hypothetical protein
MMTMMVCAVAAYLWFCIEDRNFHCIPANGYSVKVVPATISTLETTCLFYRNIGYRLVTVKSDMAHKRNIYIVFQRG